MTPPAPTTPGPGSGSAIARLLALLRHPLLWLAVMLSIFFYKEVLLGRSFSPADLLFVANPWHAAQPQGFTTPSNDLRSDQAVIAYPHRVDITTDIKRFGLPLWQDHTLAGSANTFSLHSLGAFAYPPFLAFLLLSPTVADTILHLSIPLYAALAMYLLLGRLVTHRSARLLGTLAFALNGYSIVWLSSFPLPAIVASLPLAVYLCWRFLEERHWPLGAAFATLLASVLIFSYPPGSIIFMALVAIFVACWWAQNLRQGMLPLLMLAGLGALGIGMSAVALLPTIHELSNYTSQAFRSPITTGIPLRFISTYVFPNIAGNPIAHNWRAIGNYCEFVAYDGSLPLMLALGGGALLLFRRFRASPLLLAAVIVGLLSFSLAYVGPVIRVVDARPPFNNLNPARWNFGVEFAIAVLAAYSLDQLLSKERPRAVTWSVVIGAVAVLGVAGGLLWLKRHDVLHGDQFITRDYRVRLGIMALDLVVLGWLFWGRRLNLAAIAAVAVVFADLFTFGVDFNPAIPKDQMYPQTPALRYLEANSTGYRVLPINGVYGVDQYNVYGVDVMTGYDHFRDDGYVALLGANMSNDERNLWRSYGYLTLGNNLHLDDPVFNDLSVKYAYFPTAQGAASAQSTSQWRKVYGGSDGVVLENPAVLPRQFIVRPGATAPTPIPHQPMRPDEDQLAVDGGGRLVWSKPFSRDWHISVNGREVDPQRYNGYFLSVSLPASSADVKLAYRPNDYYIGGAISAGSLVALAGIVILARTRRRRGGLESKGQKAG